MKRLFAMLLVFSLLLSTVVYAGADGENFPRKGELPKTIYVTVDENGNYINGKKADGLEATMLKEYGIYELEDGTLHVYMNYVLSRQYYAASTFNEVVETENIINKATASPHFNNPAPFAFTNINNPINESLYTNIGNLTFKS